MSNTNFQIQASTQSEFILNNPADVYTCGVNTRGTVIRTSSLNNFTTPITLSASGNPPGSTVTFSGNPIIPGTNDSITLSGPIAAGVYSVTITGTAGQVVKASTIKFIIGSPTQSPQSFPTDSVGYSLLPTFTWQATPAAVSYSLQISQSPGFSVMEQYIQNIQATSYKLTAPLTQNTEYYWRIAASNTCGTGPFSRAFLFKTVAITCADTVFSTDVPVNIPDTIITVNSKLLIVAGGKISDVDVVGLKGQHNYISDLSVRLESPANTSVELFNAQCDGGQKDFDINFDDQAQIEKFPCPPTGSLTVRPSQPLSAFNDENSAGTWTLKVTDNYGIEGGSLTNWGLRICTYATTALPVTWLTFTGSKNDNNTVTLQWATANEINNNYYEVERSSDGTIFSSIGKIAAGNSTGTTGQYLYNDVNTAAGYNYYRLKQVDNDGKVVYSRVVRVVTDKRGLNYVLFPNPASDKITVRIFSNLNNVVIRLNDISGKVLRKKSLGTVTTGSEFSFPVKGLSRGLYIFTLTSEKGISTNKLIVQ
jgi:subtilisin-like proprotein convertase family protein